MIKTKFYTILLVVMIFVLSACFAVANQVSSSSARADIAPTLIAHPVKAAGKQNSDKKAAALPAATMDEEE